jgi:hypothetical protein
MDILNGFTALERILSLSYRDHRRWDCWPGCCYCGKDEEPRFQAWQ